MAARYFFDEHGRVFEMTDERGVYKLVSSDEEMPKIPSVDYVRVKGEQLKIANNDLPLKPLVSGEWMMPDGEGRFLRTHQSVRTHTCPHCKAPPGKLCHNKGRESKGCHAMRRDLWAEKRRKLRRQGKMRRKKITDPNEINKLVKEAFEAYDKLSDEEKFEHRRQQYISFVHGNLALSGSEVSREEIAKRLDKMIEQGEIKIRI